MEPSPGNKRFNLHDPGQRDEYVSIITTRPDGLKKPASEVRAGIDALDRHLPNANWLTISQGGTSFQIHTGSAGMVFFPLEEAVQLGLRLERLSTCKGFREFLVGFANPSQFLDSVFESRMADHCKARIGSLMFNPSYIINGFEKHPDFELATRWGTMVCECKSLNESDRRYAKRLNTISSVIDSATKATGGVPPGHRLEVHINGPIKGDLEQYAFMICQEAFGRMRETGHIFKNGPFAFCLELQSNPTHFSDTGIWQEVEIVGEVPVGLGPQYAYLRVTTERIEASRLRACGDLIHDAMAQLPRDKLCVTFLEVLDRASAEEAAKKKLASPHYKHFLAIGIQSSRGLHFIYKTPMKPVIEETFGPFPSEAES